MTLDYAEPIRLFVADIDGCLSMGSASFFMPDLLAMLQQMNADSRVDPSIPAVTLCTGRPQPYVECLLQATGGYMPALCEGGAVFFDPKSYTVETHSAFGAREQDLLDELGHVIRTEMADPRIMFEPGKVTHITLILASPLRPADVLQQAEAIAARFGGEFEVETTRVCIHFLFRHLHKGTGVEWLAAHTGIAPRQMAGMGDARPDIPFLRMMGVSCAPANAQDEVKAACGHVSPLHAADAAMEFCRMLVRRNRELIGGTAQ